MGRKAPCRATAPPLGSVSVPRPQLAPASPGRNRTLSARLCRSWSAFVRQIARVVLKPEGDSLGREVREFNRLAENRPAVPVLACQDSGKSGPRGYHIVNRARTSLLYPAKLPVSKVLINAQRPATGTGSHTKTGIRAARSPGRQAPPQWRRDRRASPGRPAPPRPARTRSRGTAPAAM